MTNRQKFICDVVDKYKKDYPEDYSNFMDMMAYKRFQLKDKKLAKVKGTNEMRYVASVPAGIMNVLSYALEEEKIFEPKGELKWFIKKFPEFLVPRSY
jgi:hypothetical protein